MFLKDHQCDQVQGFRFSPAVPADELEALARAPLTDGGIEAFAAARTPAPFSVVAPGRLDSVLNGMVQRGRSADLDLDGIESVLAALQRDDLLVLKDPRSFGALPARLALGTLAGLTSLTGGLAAAGAIPHSTQELALRVLETGTGLTTPSPSSSVPVPTSGPGPTPITVNGNAKVGPLVHGENTSVEGVSTPTVSDTPSTTGPGTQVSATPGSQGSGGQVSGGTSQGSGGQVSGGTSQGSGGQVSGGTSQGSGGQGSGGVNQGSGGQGSGKSGGGRGSGGQGGIGANQGAGGLGSGGANQGAGGANQGAGRKGSGKGASGQGSGGQSSGGANQGAGGQSGQSGGSRGEQRKGTFAAEAVVLRKAVTHRLTTGHLSRGYAE